MTVLDQAENFSGGPVAAARQRDRWARREANATDAEERESYREAIADLQARYPDIAEVPIGGAEAFARERGHGTGARSPVHEGRRRSGAGRPARTGKEKREGASTPAAGRGKAKPVPGLTPGARRSSAQSRAAKGRPTPRVDRAIRQTRIPAALDSSGSTLMAGLGATVGLALLYLLLSSAETPGSGAAALPQLIHGVTRALGRFLDPFADVFPGPHLGVVPGAAPVRIPPSHSQLNRVERGSHGLPGEAGRAGIAGGDLSNPAAELQPPRPRRRRQGHR